MNFMPSEDTFFDEPLHNEAPVPQNVAPKINMGYSAPAMPQDNTMSLLLESSIRQEKLLEKLLSEMERVNRNLINLEFRQQHHSGSPAPSPTSAKQQSGSGEKVNQSRGSLLLPPGSRPATVPAVAPKTPDLSLAELAASKEQEEREAILRRRAEEDARLARIEAERLEREAEEERKRIAELKRIEEEKRMKEELEKKTRGLMSGLLTNTNAGLFGDDDMEIPGPAGKKAGGLFDD
jgi:hypothetical protein